MFREGPGHEPVHVRPGGCELARERRVVAEEALGRPHAADLERHDLEPGRAASDDPGAPPPTSSVEPPPTSITRCGPEAGSSSEVAPR